MPKPKEACHVPLWAMVFGCGMGLGLLGGGGVYDGGHLAHRIYRKPALLGMFPYHVLVGGYVHAIDLVPGDIALYPLDLWPHVPENTTGSLRYSLELLGG